MKAWTANIKKKKMGQFGVWAGHPGYCHSKTAKPGARAGIADTGSPS